MSSAAGSYVSAESFLTRNREKLSRGLQDLETRSGNFSAKVALADYVDVVRELKEDDDLAFRLFLFLSAIDWSEKEPGKFEVMVSLVSVMYGQQITIKVPVPESMEVPSLTGLFRGAAWHERECAEMFGMRFPGHPDLKKLLLTEDFEGYPLRKSFVLASRVFKPWPGALDPGETASGGRG